MSAGKSLRTAPCLMLATLLTAVPLPAQEARPAIAITRAAGEIRVDGDLSDPGWQGAVRIDTFYETNPGDNIPAPVPSAAWLTYDDRYFYAAFELSEPDMAQLRAPFGDRDNVSSSTDYGGVILDTRNDGKTAVLLLANPHGIQYDAITNDASGEDSSLDLYWDAATRIEKDGWRLEMRVPFSSLRYDRADPQTWGILLYRNRPRQFRTQMFNVKLPRGGNCFICNEAKLTGLSGLPAGNHLVLAPYGTAKRAETPRGAPGTALAGRPVDWDGGLDAKWTPNADTALDATINPDFSQVESDVAQISTNERFALFFPEKRPFFLEGLELFSTPLQAVYTRTVTSPRWGARATGELAGTAYTLLVADDQGGGSVIVPGPESSRLAPQDFASTVVVGRARHDLGQSFVSFLFTGREVAGSGTNRVAGPDFQWRPNDADVVTGQLLLSDTRTPQRSDLDPEWDGRDLASHAFFLDWSHGTRTVDWNVRTQDLGQDFRADVGYMPQVGIRDSRVGGGYSFFPEKGLFRRLHPYFFLRRFDAKDGGEPVLQRLNAGVEIEGFWASYTSLERRADKVRVNGDVFPAGYWVLSTQMSPSRILGQIGVSLVTGEAIDFANVRVGRGTTLGLGATLRPSDHLELRFDGSRQTLDVRPDEGGGRQRLFTAEVSRLKGTWTFSSRSFVRLIGQRVQVERDAGLYTFAVPRRDASFDGSTLFAYKINWQTVLFLGYGDERALEEATGQLEPARRELFLKVSYAFQR